MHEELRARGPVVLEISARTLIECDARGVATDLTPRDSDHAVCVVGWTTVDGVPCWIVRNSWGKRRVPAEVPRDLTCVTRDANDCVVTWRHWVGAPDRPGFVYLPKAYAPLHSATPSPWIAARISTRDE